MAMRDVLEKDGLLYVWQKIKALMDKKVDKVAGKQLSTNDFTDELKQKVLNAGTSSFDGQYSTLIGKPSINNIELSGNKTLTELGVQPSGNYALKTDIPTVPTKVSQLTNDSGYQTAVNVATAISGKADKTTVDTALEGKAAKTHDHTIAQITDFPTKLSVFANDSGYQTSSDVSSAIAAAVGKITSFETKVVTSLPASGTKGTIYFVPSKTTGTNQTYDEYVWVNDKWEFIGTTAMDLSGYLKDTDLVAISNADIDNIFATTV